MTSHFKTSRHRRRFGRAGRLVVTAITAALLLAGVAIVFVSLPEPGSDSGPLPSTDDVGIDPKFGDVIPTDATFRDEQGNPVQLAEFLGKRPVILAPVYFQCPMLCNLTMDGMVRGLRGLSADVGDDFVVLTVSFDPGEGPKLAAAAKQTAMSRYGRDGAEEGWHFLTGDAGPIRRLTDAIGFRYKFDEQTGQYAHAAGLFVLTPKGEISRFLSGVEFTPRDLKLALAEASEGRHVPLGDQVLLLCFHYDPANGKYGLAILRLIRFAGVLTVGALATGIVVMIRRERHPARLATRQEPPAESNHG